MAAAPVTLLFTDLVESTAAFEAPIRRGALLDASAVSAPRSPETRALFRELGW
jgi:hypothetical protein